MTSPPPQHERGQLSQRAVLGYNLLHRPWLPLIILAVACSWRSPSGMRT
jgi:hypothetical protein